MGAGEKSCGAYTAEWGGGVLLSFFFASSSRGGERAGWAGGEVRLRMGVGTYAMRVSRAKGKSLCCKKLLRHLYVGGERARAMVGVRAWGYQAAVVKSEGHCGWVGEWVSEVVSPSCRFVC